MNTGKKSLPPQVSARLPRYYRVLRGMIGEDRLRTSSGELARRMLLTPSQVRQDFSYLGGVGTQGYGYNVKDLYSAVGARIGIPMNYGAVVVCRDLRFASLLASDECFTARGVRLRAACSDGGDLSAAELRCENSAQLLRHPDGTAAYLRAARFCERQRAEGDPVSVALLCCERGEAAAAADALAAVGIRGIWNFTGEQIAPEGASVLDVNFTDALLSLCCEITACADAADDASVDGGKRASNNADRISDTAKRASDGAEAERGGAVRNEKKSSGQKGGA